MNNPTLSTSPGPRAPAVAPLADLAFDEEENTVPSTPYSRGCPKLMRARKSAGPVLRLLLDWVSAVLGWLFDRR